MKKKIRLSGVIMLILLVAFLLAGPAMAGATRTEFTAWDIPGGLEGGRSWIEDGYLHMRDLEGTSQVVQVSPQEDLLISGTASLTLNANVDLVTGCGNVWGKAQLYTAGNAYWDVGYNGTICLDANGSPQSFTTRGLAQGQGDLKGFQMRYTNVNGYMTGFILDTSNQ